MRKGSWTWPGLRMLLGRAAQGNASQSASFWSLFILVFVCLFWSHFGLCLFILVFVYFGFILVFVCSFWSLFVHLGLCSFWSLFVHFGLILVFVCSFWSLFVHFGLILSLFIVVFVHFGLCFFHFGLCLSMLVFVCFLASDILTTICHLAIVNVCMIIILFTGNTQISILLLCVLYLFVELMITMNE